MTIDDAAARPASPGNSLHPSDRRVNRRYDVSADVFGHVRMSVDLKILNISMTGLAAESEKMLRVGGHYVVRVGNGDTTTELDAVVRWCHYTRSHVTGGATKAVYQVGLDFRHILEERAPELQNLVGHAALVEVERRVFGRFRPRFGTIAVAEVDSEFALRRISFGGMLVETTDAPPLGCEVDVDLPADGGHFAATGRVAHVETRGEKTIVGIGFAPLPPEAAAVLEDFITELIH